MAPRQLGYRPGLDGVRALAVSLVILSHLGWLGDAAGRVGVLVFFVLSGFLISSLLIDERRATGRISLVGFYRRRAARLLPALGLMLAAVLIGAALIGRLGEVMPATLAAVFYVGNIVAQFGGQLGPLRHTWTLSVEEQFYLLWPLALGAVIVGARFRRAALMLLAIVAAVTFARVALLLVDGTDNLIPYASFLQLDALLLGAALALAGWRSVPRPAMTAAVSTAALIAVALLPNSFQFALVQPVVIVASAGLVLAACSRLPMFEARPAIALGRISYGVYLWHFPVIWFTVAVVPGATPALLAVTGIGLTLLVASLSYRLVERPLLRRFSGRVVRLDLAEAGVGPTATGRNDLDQRRALVGEAQNHAVLPVVGHVAGGNPSP